MHQGVAMHAFQRRARHKGILPRHLEQGGAFDDQERPEAFAAVEARIAHGLDQPRRPAQFAGHWRRRQKLIEQNLDIGGHRIEAREKGAIFVVHCVIDQRFRDTVGSYIWSYIYGITMGPIRKGYLWPTTL